MTNSSSSLNSENSQPLVDQNASKTSQSLPFDGGLEALKELYGTEQSYLKSAEIFVRVANYVSENGDNVGDSTLALFQHLAEISQRIIDNSPFKDVPNPNIAPKVSDEQFQAAVFKGLVGANGDYKEIHKYLDDMALFASLYDLALPIVSNDEVAPIVRNYNTATPDYKTKQEDGRLGPEMIIHIQRAIRYKDLFAAVIKNTDKTISAMPAKGYEGEIEALNNRKKTTEKIFEAIRDKLQVVNDSTYKITLPQALVMLEINKAISQQSEKAENAKDTIAIDKVQTLRNQFDVIRKLPVEVPVVRILKMDTMKGDDDVLMSEKWTPEEKNLVKLAKDIKVHVNINGKDKKLSFWDVLHSKVSINVGNAEKEFLSHGEVKTLIAQMFEAKAEVQAQKYYELINNPDFSLDEEQKTHISSQIANLSKNFAKKQGWLTEEENQPSKKMTKQEEIEAIRKRVAREFPNYKPLANLNARLQKDNDIASSYKGIDKALLELEKLQRKEATGKKLGYFEAKSKINNEASVQEYKNKMNFIQSLNDAANKFDQWKDIALTQPTNYLSELSTYEKKWGDAAKKYEDEKLGKCYYTAATTIDQEREPDFNADYQKVVAYIEVIKRTEDDIARLEQLRKEIPVDKRFGVKKYDSSYESLVKDIKNEISALNNKKDQLFESLKKHDYEFSRKFQITLIEKEKENVRHIVDNTKGALDLKIIDVEGHFANFSKEFAKFAEEQNATLNKRKKIAEHDDTNSVELTKNLAYYHVTNQRDSKKVTNAHEEYKTLVSKTIKSLNTQIGLIPNEMEKKRKELTTLIKATKIKNLEPKDQIDFMLSASHALANVAVAHAKLVNGNEPMPSAITEKLKKEDMAAISFISLLTTIKAGMDEYQRQRPAAGARMQEDKAMTTFRAALVNHMQSQAFADLPKVLRKDAVKLNKSLLAKYEEKLTIGERVSNFFRGNKFAEREIEKDTRSNFGMRR